LSAFLPLIDRVSPNLSGWQGKLLSIAARAILVKSCIHAMLAYAMGALLIPVGTLEAFDKRCRVFFWAGEDHVSGGQCKVAWDEVCKPFDKGGLGFASLKTRNKCLLLKLLAKVHSPGLAPWESWFSSRYGWHGNHDLGDCHRLDSIVWKDLVACLPLFRSVTSVQVGSGSSTSFWLDLWFEGNTLADRFPALLSHSSRPNCSVAFACSSPTLELALHPRLSTAASIELRSLQSLLASVGLDTVVPDIRVGHLNGKALTTKSAYMFTFHHLPLVPFATPTWKNFATNKCRLFIWLAGRRRLFTNLRRFQKGLASSDACPFCAMSESSEQLFLHCRSVQQFWATIPSLHQDVSGCSSIQELWDGAQVCKVRSTVLIAALWNIWKRRNAKVFDNTDQPTAHVFSRCAADLSLWSHRCGNEIRKPFSLTGV
jgi:hypothetical protein